MQIYRHSTNVLERLWASLDFCDDLEEIGMIEKPITEFEGIDVLLHVATRVAAKTCQRISQRMP